MTDLSTLTATQRSLVEAASKAVDAVPNKAALSDHTCGAAALSSDGRIFTGINMFHYSSSVCSENIVLANAAAAGVRSALNPGFIVGDADEPAQLVLIVAVLDEGRGVISPCGRCRQVLADYHPWIRVIVRDGSALRVAGTAELLPYAWEPDW